MAMAIWAFIDSENKAVNFVESDGVPGYIPDGCTAVQIPEGASYGYGWVWDGTKFVPPDVPVPVKVPASITRRQCALQLLNMGIITDQEAVDMTRTGLPPANVQAYIDALPTADERARAEIDFAADAYYRDNPLLEAIMIANGATDAEIDQFFIEASQL